MQLEKRAGEDKTDIRTGPLSRLRTWLQVSDAPCRTEQANAHLGNLSRRRDKKLSRRQIWVNTR